MISKCEANGHTYHPDDSRCIECGVYKHAQKTPEQELIEISMMEAERKFNKAPLEDEIREECDTLADFLVEKNRKYGNSAVEPVRIFARSDVLEQLRVRIDDKLSRVKSAQLDDDEDVINDLIGYFILYRIARKKNEKN